MKQFYSVLFSLDNTNKDQNFVIDIDEIANLSRRGNQLTDKLLAHAIVQPRQEIVNELFEMIRSGKI